MKYLEKIAGEKITISLLYSLGFAFIIRCTALLLMGELYLPDSIDYFVDGKHLFNEGYILGHKYMPLYSIISYLAGGGIGLQIFDIIISTLTVWLVFLITFKLSGNMSAATIASVIMAIYPHFVFYSIAKLSETLYLFLTCWAFLLLYRNNLVGGGVLLIISIFTRPTIYPFAPILIFLFSTFVWHNSLKYSVINTLKYLLIFIVIMSPWWMHNYEKYDAFVHMTLGDGLVFYSGNNPLNKTGGGVAYDGVGDMNVSEFKKISDLVERDRAYKEAAIDYIMSNPLHALKMMGVKFIRFWRLWPFSSEYQQLYIVVISILSYGVVLALALGFFYRRPLPQIMKISPILLFSGYLTLVHMLTIGSIRYRLPIEPFLIILASWKLNEIIGRFKIGKRLQNFLESCGVGR